MDVRTIDLCFLGTPHVIAAYLVIGPDGPVLVEAGPSTTLEALVAGLAGHGFRPADIRHVLLTHIHLDHAGSAGWWARQGAHIYVHHLGVPHLVDPARLLASATRIYGDRMESLWGEVLPVPAGQLTPVHDGDSLQVAGLTFTALETPGHARHHHAFRLDDVAFAGDVAGIHLPDSSLVSLPTPPPEFDLEAWHASIARLVQARFSVLYPTHFGAVSDPAAHLATLDDLLDQAAAYVRRALEAGTPRDDLVQGYAAWNRRRALALHVSPATLGQHELVNPLFMSVDGLLRYWRKRSAG